MAALSDYSKSGLIQQFFKGQAFAMPSNISIALTSDVATADQTGATIPEISATTDGNPNGYARQSVGNPQTAPENWTISVSESGVASNTNNIVFPTALEDWGPVSGIAVLDNSTIGSGNVLFYGAIQSPRPVNAGDNVTFSSETLDISFD